jgi:50S ribosomal protein L16 3-hydroxylase
MRVAAPSPLELPEDGQRSELSGLLGGLSARQFMRQHWQTQRPLLVRQAQPGPSRWLQPRQLFQLATREGVEARLVRCDDTGRWSLRHGPFASVRSLPARRHSRWTLLVQGVDLHLSTARELLERFRFVPDASLDDVMVSYASDGGGVGAHLDAYDVFLLQLQGWRRWRIAPPPKRPRWQAGVPLKLLAGFEPTHDWLLQPGDMLYLPPGWAHEGTAVGECLTASIGFRADSTPSLVAQLLPRLADAVDEAGEATPWRNARQAATTQAARIPPSMQSHARRALREALSHRYACNTALGEHLSEPKPQVWFEPSDDASWPCALHVHGRSRLLYDDRCVYINGESFVAGGRDALLLRRLADARCLGLADVKRLSPGAAGWVREWLCAGWLAPAPAERAGE